MSGTATIGFLPTESQIDISVGTSITNYRYTDAAINDNIRLVSRAGRVSTSPNRIWHQDGVSPGSTLVGYASSTSDLVWESENGGKNFWTLFIAGAWDGSTTGTEQIDTGATFSSQVNETNNDWDITVHTNGIIDVERLTIDYATLPYIFLSGTSMTSMTYTTTVIRPVATILALSVSDTVQPRNCFTGEAKVFIDKKGSLKRVAELKNGDEILIRSGENFLMVPIVLLRTKNPTMDESILWTHPKTGVSFETTPQHIVVVESDLVEGFVEGWKDVQCERCKEFYLVSSKRCKRCCPWGPIPGYSSLLGKDLKDCSFATKTKHNGYWYHLQLPPSHLNALIVFEGGYMGEGMRHVFGCGRRDALWKILE